MKAWPVLAILVVQGLLFLAHWFIFDTWVDFAGTSSPVTPDVLRLAMLVLAFSFMIAALLSFRYSNPIVIGIYKIAAIWLGFLNFFFFASCLCWAVWFATPVTALHMEPARLRSWLAVVLFAAAFLAGVYGLLNALWIRLRRISIHLPNLPPSWRGRTALVLSDMHLGHVNNLRFCQRIVTRAVRLNPDIVFVPGDLFDGGKIDARRLAEPFRQLKPPFGFYFTTGNHDEFGNIVDDTAALHAVGVRVLHNQKVTVDGLDVVGISYHESTYPQRMRLALSHMHLGPGASILLHHVPTRLPIVEQAGVSLQLSGHTHGGQIFPYTWFTRRIFGEFTYGLHRFGNLQVYTSSGAGTWGPPMRVGTHPEMVLLTFE